MDEHRTILKEEHLISEEDNLTILMDKHFTI